MIIKCGRKEFDVNEKDIVMFNGACYQLITKIYKRGFDRITPILAKAKAKKMIQDGILVFDKNVKSSSGIELEHYKFSIKEST